eukprot:TRINITY_DN33669_c0_g1_i1.p1 TRINITY_DN33669_c0_g1~~TRINITY_DN33669_c0_g1_i1.p1  ORF type:complete len:378 (+),score=39.43 TRINITY_DN33669_c0_g1_i1:88-1221(+)
MTAALEELGWFVNDEGFFQNRKENRQASPTYPVGAEYYRLRDAVDAYLQEQLCTKYGFTRTLLPLAKDAAGKLPAVSAPIFLSPNALANEDTLVVLLMGKGESVAGAWVSRACIHFGLSVGSIFPYVEECLKRKWACVVLNPNVTSVAVQQDSTDGSGPASTALIDSLSIMGFSAEAIHRACLATKSHLDVEDCTNWLLAQSEYDDLVDNLNAPLTLAEKNTTIEKIPFNTSAQEHTLYVYDNFVNQAAARNILFTGTSFAGPCLVHLLENRSTKEGALSRLRAVAFTDSSHFLDCKDMQLSSTTITALQQLSRNWVQSTLPRDAPVSEPPRLHSWGVSAEETDHGCVPGRVVHSVFQYFDDHLSGKISETGNQPTE